MTGGFADVFNVAGTDALLAGADPVAGGLTRKCKDDFFDEEFEIIFFRENLIAVLKRTVS